MEYLDCYDESKNMIGTFSRIDAHEKGLWHNTVHCWLYDKEGNIYFQIRSEEKKFYTTASGHVLACETVKETFGREVREETGLNIDYEKAVLVDIVKWKQDKIKNGKEFKDRAFANVYVCEIGEKPIFKFDNKETDGVVKVNAKETLLLFEKGSGEISAEITTNTEISHRNVNINEFLITDGETQYNKYKDVLNKVIELTENKNYFSELESETLLFRKSIPSDVKILWENFFNNYDNYKFYDHHKLLGYEKLEENVISQVEKYNKGNYFRWYITLKSTGELIGSINLHSHNKANNNIKIGYYIFEKHRNKGYGTESILAVMDFAFNVLEVHRITANTIVNNAPSIKVLLNAGFKLEGTMREDQKIEEKFYDYNVFGILKDDF